MFRLLTIAVGLAIALVAPTVRADAFDAAFARAIAAKERALDTHDPADWEEALDRFEQADRLRETKEGKYELATAAARLRQDDLAAEAYDRAISMGLDGPAKEKAQAFLAERAAGLARVAVTGPEGTEVSVRGRRRAVLPRATPLVLFAGENRLRLSLGDQTVERSVNLSPGATLALDVSDAFGGGADDGKSPSVAPDGGRGGPVAARSSPLGVPLLIGGGAVAAAGVVTVVAANGALGTRRDRLAEICAIPSGSDDCAQAAPDQRAQAQDTVDSIATWKAVRLGGWLGVGAGAATAVVGAVLLATGSSSPDPNQPQVGLAPLPGGALFGVSGRL